jgi:membrane-anchored protein YejM (alkaline phosphatase superfamily)
MTPERQQANLKLLQQLNEQHQARHPHHQELAARIAGYELAFRMQAEMPKVLDISKESRATLEMYGIGGADPEVDAFGRRCLLARRLVEAGVRFVQVIAMGWDSHDYIEKAHRARMQAVDKPMAALMKDLKRTGLLDETLVVWAGEFGRSPDNGVRRGEQVWGRDHNATAMPVWLAGPGLQTGQIIGATDETGLQAVEAVHPIKDFHITLLHLLGLDDNRLRFFHAGREESPSRPPRPLQAHCRSSASWSRPLGRQRPCG